MQELSRRAHARMVAALLLPLVATLLEGPPATFGRRSVVSGASAAALASSFQAQPAQAAGLSKEALATKLSRVPLFVITNKEDAPYLTEFDQATGRRGGSFFLDPRDAIETYNDVKSVDPTAALSVVPLDSVWFELPRTAADAAAAPQPKAGTSTDLRLFKIRRIESEANEAAALQKAPLASGVVPLFYTRSLTLEVDGTEQLPYFFRLQDLQASLPQDTRAPLDQREGGRAQRSIAEKPVLQVTSLDALVTQMTTEVSTPTPLLVAAAPAATVVERMGLGTANVDGGPMQAATPREDPLERLARTASFGRAGKAAGFFPFS